MGLENIVKRDDQRIESYGGVLLGLQGSPPDGGSHFSVLGNPFLFRGRVIFNHQLHPIISDSWMISW